MYIIRLTSTYHPRYLKRDADAGSNTWVIEPQRATQYSTLDEALFILDTYLKDFACDVIEWSKY